MNLLYSNVKDYTYHKLKTRSTTTVLSRKVKGEILKETIRDEIGKRICQTSTETILDDVRKFQFLFLEVLSNEKFEVGNGDLEFKVWTLW